MGRACIWIVATTPISHPRAAGGSLAGSRDLREGQTGPTSGDEALGGRADEFLASEASP